MKCDAINQDRILGALVVGVGAEIDDPVNLGLAGQTGTDRDQRHFPMVVDLGQRRGHLMRQFADGLKEAQP